MLRFISVATLVCIPCGAAQAAGFAEATCYVDGFETPVRCVSLEAPLDYDAPGGARISVTAAIVPATTARPAADPLLVLAGGPGQAATGMGPWLNSAFKPARRARDIVLFDIRGTGRSGALSCPFSLTHTAGAIQQVKHDGAACAARVGDRARLYSAREIVEDIERFRRALGAAKISLWGGSFGTRIAQHYVRKYGAHVRAAVFDASTPVAESIFLNAPLTGERAVQRLFDDCARNASCATAFPRLREDFDALLARSKRTAISASVPDPRSGQMQTVALDRDGIANLVRGALYADLTRALVPYAIAKAARGEVATLVALGSATAEWSVETMAFGSLLSVVCAEDYAKALKAPAAARSHGFMRDSYFAYFAAACGAWPHRELPAAMFEPFFSAVPALAISGEADPVTPPSSGEATLRQFATRAHVVVPNGLHTNSSDGCVAELIAAFLADPMTGGRDHACVKRAPRPRFHTTPNI